MGSKEPIRRKFLLFAVTILVKLSQSSWFLYNMKPRLYKIPKLNITVKKGDPWGIRMAQKPFSNKIFSSFCYSCLTNSDIIRMKYSKNHFESTFGSSYFKPNKTKLKLAKTVKKEPRKASFPWDLVLLFGNPMRYAFISGFNIFKTEIEI